MEQQELVSTDKATAEPILQIPGFRLQLDYISAEEEQMLIANVDAQPWQTDYRRRYRRSGMGP
jgi:hypothetical protein